MVFILYPLIHIFKNDFPACADRNKRCFHRFFRLFGRRRSERTLLVGIFPRLVSSLANLLGFDHSKCRIIIEQLIP